MRPQEVNPAKLTYLFQREFEHCQLHAGETVALLTDLQTPVEYVHASFAAADYLGAKCYEMKVNTVYSTTGSGDETVTLTRGTLEALSRADLVIVFHVVLGTKWLGEVLKTGTRVLMILDTPHELERMLPVPGLKEAVLYAKNKLANASSMRVTSDAGTDFRCELGQTVTVCQYGAADEPGRVDAWGGGHFATYANPATAQGTIVAQPGDCWIFPYVRYVEAPTTLTIRDGVITDIVGATDAFLIRQYMDGSREREGDDRPFHVSHLGWGLHPNATLDQIAVHGNDIKRIASIGRCWPGVFLFSTGPNAILPEFSHVGEVNDTRAHIDLPMFGCTVEIDGQVVIDRGRIVDERMIVAPTVTSLLAQ